MSTVHSRAARLFIVACTIACLGTAAHAAGNPAWNYVRERWGADRGFPGGEVHAFAQTPDGALWIGTDAGLVRFDGFTFSVISDTRPQAPATGPVLGLMTDAQGALWIRLRGARVLRYSSGQFDDVLWSLSPGEDAITSMCLAKGGVVMLSGLVNGTLRYDRGHFETISPITGLPRSPVTSIAQAQDGKVWMGTQAEGIVSLDNGRVTRIDRGLPSRAIHAVLPLNPDDVWIATDGGVVRWDGKNLNSNGVPQPLRNVRALALLEDRESDLWVGTASGLSRVRVSGGAGVPGGEDLRGSPATALFQDREGNIWVGSNAGIERLRESVFLTYDRSLGLPSEKNGPIYIDPLGRTWFAPLDGGLYWLEQGRVGQVTAGGLAGEVVYSISGSADEIWAGLRNRGLARIRFSDSAPQRFLVDTFTEHDGLARGAVFAVHQARDRSLWAGTLDQGVSRFKDGHFTTFTLADGLASNSVSAILETSRGDLWLATPAGLSRFSGGKWQTYRAADGLPSNSVNCLFEDSSGVLWIGSAAGLAFFDSNRFHAPEGQPEVLRQQVLGIGEDRNGFLWITTSGHVLQASRAHLLQGPLSPSDVREYGLADGLRGMEGVRRSRSLVADARGRIWLSTNGGISVIDPALLRVASPVTARLQSIFADGASIGLQANTRIPPGRRRISFDYSGISLAAPGRVRFRYKLEGFDRDWSPPVAGREVAYTNLSPGAYTFHLMASGGDDGWSGPEATTSIVVDPLFWQTWWFRTLSGLALLGTAALAYRLRMRQLAGHLTLRFEERLAERSRIARELHDTLLQGLLSASMQLHVADDRLPDDSPAKPLLGRVLQLMSQVIDEGRNAVRGLRSHTVPACELEQAFSRVPDELAIRREQGFRVIVEGAPRPLNALIRDEAYRIGREALVNAFRHSQAGHIEIELEYARDRMRIMVRDDGIGIVAPKQQPASGGHWGLTGMRERAETIGARLSVRSRSHAGTEVELSIPAMIAFDVHAGEKRARWFSRARRDGGRQQSGRGMGSGK